MIGFALLLAAAHATGPSPRLPCDGPEADPWVVQLHDRVMGYNDLAAFAVSTWGDPVDCDGQETTEFDGARYGTLTLSFAAGVTLVVETQPIETSIVTLRAPGGFSDPDSVRAALRDYAEGVGVHIDWSAPDRTMDGDETTEAFADPELNASASHVTEGGRLVAVRFSLAL